MLVATESSTSRKMQTNVIHLQDCVQGMLALPEKSIDIVTTSPPYNLGIEYGTYQDNKPRQEYLAWLSEVFAAVKHCLKDNGHFWLNVGYSNIDPWVGMDVAQVAREHFVLQNNFTWVKSITIDDVTTGHFKPINSNRFANPTWEHLFHFTKTGAVPCDKLAIGVPYMWDCNIDNTGRIRGRLAKKFGYTNIKDFNQNATDKDRKAFDSDRDEDGTEAGDLVIPKLEEGFGFGKIILAVLPLPAFLDVLKESAVVSTLFCRRW